MSKKALCGQSTSSSSAKNCRVLNTPPILSAVGSIGGITSTVSGNFKSIKDGKNDKQQLEENIRHNRSMKIITMGKGLYLT